jgi:hypothetical protein
MLLCKSLNIFFNLTPKPDKLHRLAILFPVDKEQPGVVWVRVEPKAETKTGDKNGRIEVKRKWITFSIWAHCRVVTSQRSSIYHRV